MLDEFCIRNLAGQTVGWVFGLSVFSLKGEHVGWFEDGVFYDVDNKALGFVPGAAGLAPPLPPLAPEPAIPVLGKRPCVPTLRGRSTRPRGGGWSRQCLADYFACTALPAGRAPFMACRAAHMVTPACGQPR